MVQPGRGNGRLQHDVPQGETNTTRWEYLGVGCFSLFVGFAGGGMIAVLIAKVVGALARCPAEAESGAPCNWFTYAVFGALIGAVLVPSISIWFFRRGRMRARHNERG
jgi:hypothetical protein